MERYPGYIVKIKARYRAVYIIICYILYKKRRKLFAYTFLTNLWKNHMKIVKVAIWGKGNR